MHYAKNVKDFVVTNFLFGDGTSLQEDASFLESGVIDSTGILELITFLESTYEIKVQPDEMIPENLDSVNRVAAFLSRKNAKVAP